MISVTEFYVCSCLTILSELCWQACMSGRCLSIHVQWGLFEKFICTYILYLHIVCTGYLNIYSFHPRYVFCMAYWNVIWHMVLYWIQYAINTVSKNCNKREDIHKLISNNKCRIDNVAPLLNWKKYQLRCRDKWSSISFIHFSNLFEF